MAWKRLPLDEDEIAGTRRAFKKRPKFLLDENLGDDAAEWLRSRGHNVKTVRELGKAGASDQEIYQLARRQGRMLMTRDANDFWDDGAFPIAGSPGLLVVEGDYYASVVYAERYFGGMAEVWKESKLAVSGDGTMRIKQRDFESGGVKTTRYRFHRKVLEQWGEEE